MRWQKQQMFAEEQQEVLVDFSDLMADTCPPDLCGTFFLYDGSKVREESDPTRAGICYFYPEETPMDDQELLCSQLAGVCRCVSELSRSPARLIKMRRRKFAICMRGNFLWALCCDMDIPDASVCGFLDQLIGLFSFYNGPVRESYELHSKEDLAVLWSQYLSHLQGGSNELHHIFSSLRTIDATHIDPLLLLKAALILQACQRCSLVLAGCILYGGRVVSTQMPPTLTAKVMVFEPQQKMQYVGSLENGQISSANVTCTPVFLTHSELHALQQHPVDKLHRFPSYPQSASSNNKPLLLSRTLSDTYANTGHTHASLDSPSQPATPCQTPNSLHSSTSEETCFTPGNINPTPEECDNSLANRTPLSPSGDEQDDKKEETVFRLDDTVERDPNQQSTEGGAEPGVKGHERRLENDAGTKEVSADNYKEGEVALGLVGEQTYRQHSSPTTEDEVPLLPRVLYQHRVRGLMLALLVEPTFPSNSDALEEVYHSSMASLNGLEAHLRNVPMVTMDAQGAPPNYIFTHYDSPQNTITTNLPAGPKKPAADSFLRATSLVHSQFCEEPHIQEVIVRSADAAVYANRTVTQETYFLQQGAAVRNSGIPNPQDSAFSLPSKARHRLLKHGVNLL